ncbi:MAG: hypothetical protein ACLFPX_05425 [Candidatus Omnitrophota bacterium]
MRFNRLSYPTEWFAVLVIVGLCLTLGLQVYHTAIKRVYTLEALSNMGEISSSLERCYLQHGAYAACQGGFMWEGNWNLDIEDPADVPNAHFEYGVWADHSDWLIAARRNERSGGDAGDFLVMSTYSDKKLISCGFGSYVEECKDLELIVQ